LSPSTAPHLANLSGIQNLQETNGLLQKKISVFIKKWRKKSHQFPPDPILCSKLRKPSATLDLGALGDLLLGHFPAALPKNMGV